MDNEILKELLKVTEENVVLKNENQYLKEKINFLESEPKNLVKLHERNRRGKKLQGQLKLIITKTA